MLTPVTPVFFVCFSDLVMAQDQRYKDMVFGFIKRVQNLLPCTVNPYYTIPSSIGDIVSSYYKPIEYFTDHGDKMTINQTGDIVVFTKKGRSVDHHTVYGSFKITNKSLPHQHNIFVE